MNLPVFYESPEAPVARIYECRMARSRQDVSATSLATIQERRRRMRARQWPLARDGKKSRRPGTTPVRRALLRQPIAAAC
jgi:hypothetical protein